MQGGQHARIGEPEIAEVEVPRMLAAEDRPVSAIRALMNEWPTRVRTRLAAVLGDDLRDRP